MRQNTARRLDILDDLAARSEASQQARRRMLARYGAPVEPEAMTQVDVHYPIYTVRTATTTNVDFHREALETLIYEFAQLACADDPDVIVEQVMVDVGLDQALTPFIINRIAQRVRQLCDYPQAVER